MQSYSFLVHSSNIRSANYLYLVYPFCFLHSPLGNLALVSRWAKSKHRLIVLGLLLQLTLSHPLCYIRLLVSEILCCQGHNMKNQIVIVPKLLEVLVLWISHQVQCVWSVSLFHQTPPILQNRISTIYILYLYQPTLAYFNLQWIHIQLRTSFTRINGKRTVRAWAWQADRILTSIQGQVKGNEIQHQIQNHKSLRLIWGITKNSLRCEPYSHFWCSWDKIRQYHM